jgi:hypothetical protein
MPEKNIKVFVNFFFAKTRPKKKVRKQENSSSSQSSNIFFELVIFVKDHAKNCTEILFWACLRQNIY